MNDRKEAAHIRSHLSADSTPARAGTSFSPPLPSSPAPTTVASHEPQPPLHSPDPYPDTCTHTNTDTCGDTYTEGPYLVFTAAYHLRRGYCCNSGCRHCPYK